MKNKIVILLLIFLLAGVITLFLVRNINLTGRSIQELNNYTYTTAICSGSSCIDVKIECFNGEVVGMEPISDLKFFGEDWKDVRNKTADYCD